MMLVIMMVKLVFRFKNVHKRKAEQERMARLDEEEEQLDEFPPARHESFPGDLDFVPVPGSSGRSGAEPRVGFEVPPRAKSSRREAAFSYQIHPQVKPALLYLRRLPWIRHL